jgi:hypothetical protein
MGRLFEAPLRATTLTLGVALLLALAASTASAQIYRWVDEHGVAHFVDGIENVPQPFRPRATPLGYRNAPREAAPATPATGQAARPGPVVVRFTPGERIVVDARLNGTTATRLILDTGADRTVIAPRALVAAGASPGRGTVAAQIVGVTGRADVQGVPITSLEIGEAKVGPLMVVSHDVDQPEVDGLLGRDVLEQFNVSIDPAAGIVTLAPK